MGYPCFLLAYFSPETVLPLSSIIATIAGFALLIKRSSFRFIARAFRAGLRRRSRIARLNRPHFRVGATETIEAMEVSQTTRA
jgi:hypothetical protein